MPFGFLKAFPYRLAHLILTTATQDRKGLLLTPLLRRDNPGSQKYSNLPTVMPWPGLTQASRRVFPQSLVLATRNAEGACWLSGTWCQKGMGRCRGVDRNWSAEAPRVQELTFPPIIAQALDLGDPGQEQTVFS